MGLRAFRDPALWNDLLIPPPPLVQIEQGRASEIAGAHLEWIGGIDGRLPMGPAISRSKASKIDERVARSYIVPSVSKFQLL